MAPAETAAKGSHEPHHIPKISEKEADQLARHFKDPEFCRLFEEYAWEMADPKARAEQDAYLVQLEAEGQLEGVYGAGVQVIQADPGLVVKTKTADGTTRVYINVCTCPKVDEMSITQAKGEQRSSVMLPNMLSSKSDREGKSPDGRTFKVWDFIVHPESLTRCISKPALMELLFTVATEKVEEAAHVKLLRQHKLLAVQYKGVAGEQRPPALLLRTAGTGDVVDGRLRPLSEPGAPSGSPKCTDTAPSRDAAPQRTSRSRFSFEAKSKHSTSAVAEAAGLPAGMRTPQYQIVERARVDLGAAWADAGRGLQISNLPEALVVHINLPGVSSVAGVDLSVTADSVSLEVPGKYKLQLPLRHKISDQQASAKFLTSKQQLVLTLPVALPPTTQQASHEHKQGQQLVQEVQQPEDSGTREQQDRGKECEPATGSLQQPAVTPTALPSTLPSDSSAHPTWSSAQGSLSKTGSSDSLEQPGAACADPAAAASQPDAAGSPHAARAAEATMQPQTSSRTQNQVKWEELHQQAAASSHEQGATTIKGTVSVPQDAAVQASAAPALVPATTKAAAPLLRPRLSSRLVSTSDFV